MWTCRLMSVYLTIRFGFMHFLQSGHMVLGHDFEYTGEVHYDHWIMECKRCAVRAAIDEGPKKPIVS